MNTGFFNKHSLSPKRIFTLRESAFANDLFIAAVSYFDFFNWLNSSPVDIDTIYHSLNIQKRPADVMLTLFKAYGLINEKNNLYYLTDISEEYLVDKSDYNLSSYISTLKNRPNCQDMIKVMQTGRPTSWAADKEGKDWATSMEDDTFAESFTSGMNSRGVYLARSLSKAIDFQGYKNILDIGGGSGIYSIIILENNPDLNGAVFEKPPVDKVVKYNVNKRNMSDRIKVIDGDMFIDKLPYGYDVHLLSHVLHDWDFKAVRAILKNSFSSLNSGGKIIIHDAHINRTKTGPISVAEYSVLLMFLSEGKCYSVKEMKDILKETGFRNIEYHPTIYNRSVITGTK